MGPTPNSEALQLLKAKMKETEQEGPLGQGALTPKPKAWPVNRDNSTGGVRG